MNKPSGAMDIPGYEGRYAACRDGRIFSYGFRGRYALDHNDANARGRILKAHIEDSGHPTILIKDNSGLTRRRFIHHLVLEAFVGPMPAGKEADHKNRIQGDNRSCNLRWATKQINCRNSLRRSKCTHFRGLAFNKRAKNRPWRAQCVDLNGRCHFTKQIANEEDAARAYDELATKLLGPIAITNKMLGLL